VAARAGLPCLEFQGGGLAFLVLRPPPEANYLLFAVAVVIRIARAFESDGVLRIRRRLWFGLRNSRLGGLVDLGSVSAADWVHHGEYRSAVWRMNISLGRRETFDLLVVVTCGVV
jgi:hypothetical protein